VSSCYHHEFRIHKYTDEIPRLRPTITIDERDRKDYVAPPTDLFQSYCAFIAKRYSLLDKSLIQQTTVSDIDYDYIPHLSPDEKTFTVRTEDSTLYARSVVLSVGAGNAPCIPKPFPEKGCPAACHAFQPADGVLRERLRKGLSTNVVVVGGGLTSAQIVDRAIRQGVSKVYHIMRGPMKGEAFCPIVRWG
jgi:lysine/ornithine N-monooxygenase